MSSSSAMICSQGVMLAAAMVVSSTIIFLSFSRDKDKDKERPTSKSTLRSCFHSEEKRKQSKKKRVCFSGNVKETKGNGEEYRREQQRKKNEGLVAMEMTKVERICRNQMPANRIALYDGILRDRIHRIQSSC